MRVHVISVAVLFCCGLLAFGSLGAAQTAINGFAVGIRG